MQRAPEENRIGEENALLDVDFSAIGEKAPGLAAGRGKRDGVGVARKICRDARAQMKADGKAAEGLDIYATAGGLEVVVALQGQPGLQERELAAMDVAEAVAIAVVADRR